MTLPDCLHTFCRVCLVKYILEHSNAPCISCPRCGLDLGTYSQVSKQVKHDRNLQVICDALFPMFDSPNNTGKLSNDNEELSKSPNKETLAPQKDASNLHAPPEARKSSVAPKSLHNILSHKLLAPDMLVQNELRQEKIDEKKRKHAETASVPPKGDSTTESVPIHKKKKSGGEAPPSASHQADNVDSLAVAGVSTATPVEKEQSQVKLLPERNVELAIQLPELPRPTFRSHLDVKVVKIQNFVYKRLPSSLQAELSVSDIDILFSGESLLDREDLQHLDGQQLTDGALLLTYHRKK